MSVLDELHKEILNCHKCGLARYRTHAVPGEGAADAQIMFIGEAPGRDEDIQGRPFVGAAGKFLTALLNSIDVKRTQVFITNVVKCRPPNNREPREDEINTCNDYLVAQIACIKPKVICTLGNYALRTLLPDSPSISKVHGLARRQSDIIFIPLYHPAAALYNENMKRIMVLDIRKLTELLR